MSRLVFRSIAIALSLLPVVAPAAPAHKRPAPRWHGYGFLPGYHQPPNNSLPAYAQKASVSRMARHNRRPWYIDPIPSYYGYDGDWHYFGRPGFYGGRYNGGSFGPCWTRTPIGYRLKTGACASVCRQGRLMAQSERRRPIARVTQRSYFPIESERRGDRRYLERCVMRHNHRLSSGWSR